MYVQGEGQSGAFLQTVLSAPPLAPIGPYRVVLPHQNLYPDTTQPLFFQDNARVFLVTMPQGSQQANGKYRFDVFYIRTSATSSPTSIARASRSC